MKSKKISTKEILMLADTDSKSEWKSLSDEDRKIVKSKFWLMNRYASLVRNKNKEKEELAILATNDYYNKNYMVVAKDHLELQWQLLCMSCKNNDSNTKHEWIPLNQSTSNKVSKYVKIIAEFFPQMKIDEVELLATLSTKKEIEQLIRDHGLEPTIYL